MFSSWSEKYLVVIDGHLHVYPNLQAVSHLAPEANYKLANSVLVHYQPGRYALGVALASSTPANACSSSRVWRSLAPTKLTALVFFFSRLKCLATVCERCERHQAAEPPAPDVAAAVTAGLCRRVIAAGDQDP